MEKKKKALAEITGPYRLLQVFWIAVQYPDYEWDIVLRYIDGKTETVKKMEKQCIDSGLFSNIFLCMETNRELSFWGKVKKSIYLVLVFLFFQRDRCFKRDIEKVVGCFDYDLILTEPSFALFSCELMYFGKNHDVCLLEDGTWEYAQNIFPYGIVMRFIGRFFFLLGIYNFVGYKNFSLNKRCIKYASNPSELLEKNYKEVRMLFSENSFSTEYNSVLKKTYDISDVDYDLIVFTTDGLGNTDESFKGKVIAWLEEHYSDKKILIKPHPLDSYQYSSSKCNLVAKYKTIPGEVILSIISDTPIIFMYPSTLLMFVKKGDYDYMILDYSDDLINSVYRHSYDEFISTLSIPDNNIIKI